ncbi:LemA family protein [Pseudomonas aeruginosa]|nr:LemA family protein [Pseudomonas aeruginosa]ELL4401385.1 LemA family protein [Pseudomonas aeruginosa]
MDISVIITIAVVTLVVLSTIGLYNGIIGGHNRAQRAWSDVLAFERAKTKVLEALLEQAKLFKEYESNVVETVTRLRSAISGLPKEANGDALETVERETKELLGGLRVAFEAYPDLKASEVVNSLMREISEKQDNVAASITIFNREVERFNNAIQMFPGSLVNSFLNKKKAINPFTDGAASAGFEYRPNF